MNKLHSDYLFLKILDFLILVLFHTFLNFIFQFKKFIFDIYVKLKKIKMKKNKKLKIKKKAKINK